MPQREARHYRLGDMAADSPMPGILRRRIIGQEAMVSDVRIEKGCEVPWHQHPNEQSPSFKVACSSTSQRPMVGHGGTSWKLGMHCTCLVT
jgi:hypothetical protein